MSILTRLLRRVLKEQCLLSSCSNQVQGAPLVHADQRVCTAEYADCFIDPEKLPEEALSQADILVTGTLGLAYPMTAKAMHRSVELARSSGKCQVSVQIQFSSMMRLLSPDNGICQVSAAHCCPC